MVEDGVIKKVDSDKVKKQSKHLVSSTWTMKQSSIEPLEYV